MKKINEENLWQNILDNPSMSKYLKIAITVTSCVAGIYLLGHLFKISAHAINGYNKLKSAIINE